MQFPEGDYSLFGSFMTWLFPGPRRDSAMLDYVTIDNAKFKIQHKVGILFGLLCWTQLDDDSLFVVRLILMEGILVLVLQFTWRYADFCHEFEGQDHFGCRFF